MNWRNYSLAPFWTGFGACLLALGWLLPNNARPWSSFHTDAFSAVVLACVASCIFLRSRCQFSWNGFAVLCLACSMTPLVQYWSGVLPFAGQAWIATFYLLGLCMAVMAGSQWIVWRRMQFGDFIFGAVLIAGTVSVIIQLMQWLDLTTDGPLDIWTLQYNGGGRPYANLGQPNQLASLLLWALISCGWWAWRGRIGVVGAAAGAFFLAIGLALTQSRSAMLGSMAMLAMVWLMRYRLRLPQKFAVVATAVFCTYLVLLVTLPMLGQSLMLDTQFSVHERTTSELRPLIWKTLLSSVPIHPWQGYGWNQILPAQLDAASNGADIRGLFLAQSHNLFLDFILWLGAPLGIFLSLVIAGWISIALCRLQDVDDYLYFSAIMVIGIHAMLEFPLHYANFLLPTGLMVGALSRRLNIWHAGPAKKWIILLIHSFAVSGLIFMVFDYFRLEKSYSDIRFKQANFKNAIDPVVPEAMVLNHLQYLVEFYLLTPSRGMSDEDVEKFVNVTISAPSPFNVGKLIVVLSINKRQELAQIWRSKANKFFSENNFHEINKELESAARLYPEVKTVLSP